MLRWPRAVRHAVIAAMLLSALGGCAAAPTLGPPRDMLAVQGAISGKRQFDVVVVDARVVSALQEKRPVPFREHFQPYTPPPHLPIEIGDRLSITIWEGSVRGLFAVPQAQRRPRLSELAEAIGPDAPVIALTGGEAADDALVARLETTAKGRFLLASLESGGRAGTALSDLPVGRDGWINIPYAGRIEAAGRSAAAVQSLIERRLAARAGDLRALVIVKRSPANSVTVTGELVAGARVPLDPRGSRLLQVIAAAGGARAPPHNAYIRLSRSGVTASVPLATLVEHPEEDIYARPGDIVSVERRPQLVSVVGATGGSTAFSFDSDTLSLAEALGKAGGPHDDRADPRAVFVLRYETPRVIERLGLAPIPAARDGPTPVAYRFDLGNDRAAGFARHFAMRDRDVIYVAEAETEPIRRFFEALGEGVRSAVNGLVCIETKC